MKATLIQIGNSKGIRIPKPVIEQCGFEQDVDLVMNDHELIIRPITHIREGWDEAFARMNSHNDDMLLDETASTEWDAKEWQW